MIQKIALLVVIYEVASINARYLTSLESRSSEDRPQERGLWRRPGYYWEPHYEDTGLYSLGMDDWGNVIQYAPWYPRGRAGFVYPGDIMEMPREKRRYTIHPNRRYQRRYDDSSSEEESDEYSDEEEDDLDSDEQEGFDIPPWNQLFPSIEQTRGRPRPGPSYRSSLDQETYEGPYHPEARFIRIQSKWQGNRKYNPDFVFDPNLNRPKRWQYRPYKRPSYTGTWSTNPREGFFHPETGHHWTH